LIRILNSEEMMEDILDIDEACEFLKLSKPMIYKYVRKGQIPAFKVGRVWRFDRKTLHEWAKIRISTDTEARSRAKS
jgi:excisionase family DNA binding protein